jgi:type IV secretion system protein VirB8
MKDPELQAYFDEAASWDRDRVAMQRRSARLAWWVAGAGWIATLALVAVLVMLMPLKRVEPFVIRVDNASGMVDVVPVYVGQEAMPEMVSRYFLTHYVTVCERFNFPTAESDYQECGAPHSAAQSGLVRDLGQDQSKLALEPLSGWDDSRGPRDLGELLYPCGWGNGRGASALCEGEAPGGEQR